MTPDETRRLAASGAVAGLAPTTEADLGDGTFAARAYVDARGGASGSAAIPTPASTRSPSCGSSNGRSGLPGRRATCSRPRTRRWGRRSTRPPPAAARRPRPGRRAPSRRDVAPISSCSTPTIPRLPGSRSLRCWMRRSSAPAGDRCATSWSGGAGSCATVIIRTRTPYSRVIAPAWRAYRHEHRRIDLLITGAHLATMTGDAPYGAIRDGAVGISGERIAWVGAERDLPREVSAQPAAARSRRLGDARSHRLPHPPRVCRQSRERVRGAPHRRLVRGDRARRAAESTRPSRRRGRRATGSWSRRAGRGSRRWRARA